MHDLERISDHKELVPSRHNHADRIRDWVELFKDIYKVADALSRTAFVPAGMSGKTEDIAACMMKGFELGMDPLDALASMYVVHGKVGVTAEFMRRRIIQAGHSFKIVESTDARAIVEATRRDGGEPHRATFTSEQARKAGVDIGKYPADKLIARATSRLCRQSFPDVLSGSLLVEELEDGVTQEPAIAAKPAAVKRKHATPKPIAADTQPKEIRTKPSDEDVDTLLYDEVAAEHDHLEIANPEQTRKIGDLFTALHVADRSERREVMAHILGYAMDDWSLMTQVEADKIIKSIRKWMDEEGSAAIDRVNDILNNAALRDASDGFVEDVMLRTQP